MSDGSTKPYDEDARDRFRKDAEQISKELRTRGVLFFDSDDDFSFEFPLRDFYLPEVAEGDNERPRFGLFLGWEWRIDVARAFLDVISREAAIVAWRFVEMLHQGAGHDCIPKHYLVTPVRIQADVMRSIKDIVRQYRWSLLTSPPYARESEKLEYIAFTARYEITVSEALARTDCLMESVYPMDASQANLQRLAADPDRHRRALEPLMKSNLLAERLSLFLISDNCD